jgi:ABC-type Fe3+-hydroxamate transport system substrate-binding protein
MLIKELSHSFVPNRIVSLVPSITESLFDLDLGKFVVGRTRYCVFPKGKVEQINVVGGTKDADYESILRCEPDLVIANQEENSKELVEKLDRNGNKILLIFPKSVNDTINLLFNIAQTYPNTDALQKIVLLQKFVEIQNLSVQGKKGFSYFAPIWCGREKENAHWWMTFNDLTYSSDVLKLFNGHNIFGQLERKYPQAEMVAHKPADVAGEQDTRYPIISEALLRQEDPEMIIFPDEPYPFSDDEIGSFCAKFKNLRAVQNHHIIKMDGTLINWHGTRLARALSVLPEIFNLH